MSDRVVHFEVPYADGDRARTFYAEAFGWQVQEMPEMSYTMVQTGPVGEDMSPTGSGYINGGMFERSEPFSGPVITIGVDDIDASIAKVRGLGATDVADKQPVGDMGFACYFRDPEGNLIGLWQDA